MAFFNEPVETITGKIRQGTVRSLDIVNRALERIAAGNSAVHAFITVAEEQARAGAIAVDALSAEEKAARPLCGIPIAVKDNICTKELPTTCASRILEGFRPPYNATVVDRLEKAGAIIIGKTNMDEFAMGSSTESSAVGVTRNPHNHDYIPGGSSGGSAAAVAADFVPLALGSDTGGSIRQPASHCGVIGMKPTYGRVSRYGLVAFASSLDQIGPFAKDIRDVSLLLSVLAGGDDRDSTCAGKSFDNDRSLFDGSARGLRVGVPKEYFSEGLSASVRTSLETLMRQLTDIGVTFVDISLPRVSYAIATYYIICTAEASSNLARYDGVKYGLRAGDAASLSAMYKKTRHEGFGAEVKRRILLGTYVLSSGYYDAYYLKAAKVRTLITRDFERAFECCDAIISPVATTPAFKLGEKCNDPLQMYLTDIYTVSANLAGIPGISIPCGKDGGLPVGVQFMAPKWREDTLIRLGNLTQTVTGTLDG